MKPNIILNGIYVTAEHYYQVLSESLVLTQSQLGFNGSGATGNMDFKLPIGNTVTVSWGDGTADATVNGNDSTTVTVSHTYSTAEVWTVTFSGDLDTITSFVWDDTVKIQGDIVALTDWTALTNLDIESTSMTGDIACLSDKTGMVALVIHDTGISGELSSLSPLTSLINMFIQNTSISGDIADLAPLVSLNFMILNDTSVDTYTAGVLPDWDACNITISNLGLDQTESNNFLINLDTASSASTKTLTMTGNTAPSGAGITAASSLGVKGWTVNTD